MQRYHRLLALIALFAIAATPACMAAPVSWTTTSTSSTVGDQVSRDDLVKLARLIANSLKPREAMVIGGEGNSIYIDVGLSQGVSPGMTFEIIRYGPELKTPSGEVLGREETILGQAKLVRIRDKYSIAEPVTGLIEPACIGDAAVQQGADALVNVAVAQFTAIGSVSDSFLEYVREVLTTELAGYGNFRIVERSKIDKILEEGKLSMSGLIDQRSAQELGRMLGANALIVGSVSQSAVDYALTARVIAGDTGSVVVAHSVQAPKVTLTAASNRTRSVFEIMDELQERIDALERRIAKLESENTALRRALDDNSASSASALRSIITTLNNLVSRLIADDGS